VKRILAGIAGAIAAVVFVGAAMAGPFEEGVLAYQRGDYPVALALWTTAAAEGHERAGFRLALMYDSGIGVTRDNAEATRWFRRSAEKGAADAQFYVGLVYYEGKGELQNFFQAAHWFELAADQGHAESLFMLGFLYENGWGVRQDFAEAERWYALAAEKGRYAGR
jgi:TPR repeat protein